MKMCLYTYLLTFNARKEREYSNSLVAFSMKSLFIILCLFVDKWSLFEIIYWAIKEQKYGNIYFFFFTGTKMNNKHKKYILAEFIRFADEYTSINHWIDKNIILK